MVRGILPAGDPDSSGHAEATTKIHSDMAAEGRNVEAGKQKVQILGAFKASAAASAGETDRDLAATQFLRNCVAYNIIEF